MKLQDRISSKGLRDRLGLDDIISVLQQNRLRWYGHVLQKEDNDWVKKCMEYELQGASCVCDTVCGCADTKMTSATFAGIY